MKTRMFEIRCECGTTRKEQLLFWFLFYPNGHGVGYKIAAHRDPDYPGPAITLSDYESGYKITEVGPLTRQACLNDRNAARHAMNELVKRVGEVRFREVMKQKLVKTPNEEGVSHETE